MTKYEEVREEEIEDDSTCPSLESYMDGNAINMGGEIHKGLGGKINVDNYYSQQIKMFAFFTQL